MPNPQTDRSPHVLIVSKPLAPPWNDSSKNLAKDIAVHCSGKKVLFTVLGTPDTRLDYAHIQVRRIFKTAGAYQPGLMQNVKTLMALARHTEGVHLYHYFFAPNPRTSTVLKLFTRWKAKKSLHTICSRPREFEDLKKMIFADKVVAVSEDTLQRLKDAGLHHAVKINPGIRVESNEELAGFSVGPWGALKQDADFCVLYPGDYEFSGGHEILLRILPEVIKNNHRIKFIFACRKKTAKAAQIEAQVKNRIEKQKLLEHVVFLNEVESMKALIRACDLTIFPVKSLLGKMDIPLVLLEALALERPVLVSDLEPLKELGKGIPDAVFRLQSPDELGQRILQLSRNRSSWQLAVRAGRQKVLQDYNISLLASEYEKLYEEMG